MVGGKILRLEFERGHDPFALLAVEIKSLLAGGFSGVDHGGEAEIGVLGIADAFLQETVNKGVVSPLLLHMGRSSQLDGLDGSGSIRGQVDVSRRTPAPHLQAEFKSCAIIIEDADVDQRLAHGKLLVAVLTIAAHE